MKIEVILHPAEFREFAQRAHPGTVCVVFDVLRATSTMVTALAHGVGALLPVATLEEAFSLRAQTPGALLGGERHGDRVEGFDFGNSPVEYSGSPGATIVMTTTNGTGAIQACRGAECVLVAALLNLEAVAGAVRARSPERLVVVCSGTGSDVAMEDVWAAGALVDQFCDADLFDWSDSAYCAHGLFLDWPDSEGALRASTNGRALLAKGRELDLVWCAILNRYAVVGEFRDGAVRLLPGTEGGDA